MATLNHDHENHALVAVKGAPERIFGMCDRQRTVSDSTEAIDKTYWHEKAEVIAAQGQRAYGA